MAEPVKLIRLASKPARVVAPLTLAPPGGKRAVKTGP
jgi:hypothetical protein